MMRGLFTPLREIGETLRVKLSKLATEVGAAAIKEMGYRTKKEFLEEKHRILFEVP